MRSVHLRHVIDRLRQAFPGGKSGSTMLWAIGALVVLGVAGATVALMSPAALQSKLEQEAGMRAYYNANAGLNYILGMQQAAQVAGTNFSNFTSNLGGGSAVTYNLGGNGVFSYQLGNIVTNGTNGTYQVTNLAGSITNSTGSGAYSYVIYGGGKGSSSVYSYIPSSSSSSGAQKYVIYAGNADVSISGSANVVGNVSAKTLTVEQATITGDVITYGDAKLNFSTVVTKSLCSTGNATLTQSQVGGDLNASGNVTLNYASKVGGSVYSGGYVVADDQVVISGATNAQTYINLGYQDSFVKNVCAYGDITCKKSEDTMSANAYSGGTISLSYNSKIVGVAIGKKVIPGSGSVGSYIETTSYPPNLAPTAPTSCAANTVPPVASFTTGTTDVSVAWGVDTYKKSNPLPPGKYKDLKLSGGSPITLKAGVYYFNTVDIGYGSTIYYDVSGGDITIFVTGNVSINATGGVNVSTDGSAWKDMLSVATSNAAKVYWETHGTGAIQYGTNWFGTLYSTKAITLGGNNNVVGALVTSGTISNISWAASITYVASDYALANW